MSALSNRLSTSSSSIPQGDEVETQCLLHGDRLTRVEVLLESIKDAYLEPIKEQVTKTNGRVDTLEKTVNDLDKTATKNKAWIGFLWIAVTVIVAAMSSLSGVMFAHMMSK